MCFSSARRRADFFQALQKLDVNQKLDLAHTTFRNGGLMAKYHATNYEIALYDKVKDLEHAAKFGDRRGAETDYGCQSDLFARHPESQRSCASRCGSRRGRSRPCSRASGSTGR
jgi:hypothetical protein